MSHIKDQRKASGFTFTTLCRDRHFILGVESLKKNGWAKYTDVYIGLDYPAKETHWNGYRKICDYLENGDFSIFASFNIIKRTSNIGSLANIDTTRDLLMEQYDRWIMAEDDIEFAPVFLEYMNKCLDYYEDDPDPSAPHGLWDLRHREYPQRTAFLPTDPFPVCQLVFPTLSLQC